MSENTILPCFYPTSALVVDDQRSFLRMIEIHLRQNHLPCKIYDDPNEVLDNFSNATQAQSMFNKTMENNTEMDNKKLSDHPVNFDIFPLHNIVYNTDRFNDVAVIVVDHDMPQMSGPVMIEKLKAAGVAAKIVMLTGAADEHVAIDLFHKRSINKFIMKNSPDAAEKLVEVLHELQWEYFYEQSAFLSKALLADPRCYLSHKKYIALFNTLVNRHDIAEYYLVDGRGSFLLADNRGDVFFLALKDQKDLDYYVSVCNDAGAPEAVKSALVSKTSIPFFFSEKDNEQPPSEWQPFLHPAEKLDDNLYYAFFKITSHEELRFDSITSYAQHILESRQK